MCGRTILRLDGDDPGFAADLTGHDIHLLRIQFATVETSFLALDICQGSDTAETFYLHTLSVRQFKDLLFLAVRVEFFPFLAVDKQLVDARRVDQFDIVHIQVIAVIQAVVGAESGIVARRENEFRAFEDESVSYNLMETVKFAKIVGNLYG